MRDGRGSAVVLGFFHPHRKRPTKNGSVLFCHDHLFLNFGLSQLTLTYLIFRINEARGT